MVRVVTRPITVVLLLGLWIGQASAKDDDDGDAVYVEHAVSLDEAQQAAEKLVSQLGSGHQKSGCGKCTTDELHYCLGDSVLTDHCCCDSRYLEWFPYVPHTCYLTRGFCTPIARDCEAYNRIRVCCCDTTTARKWTSLLTNYSTASYPTSHSLLLYVLLLISYLLI